MSFFCLPPISRLFDGTALTRCVVPTTRHRCSIRLAWALLIVCTGCSFESPTDAPAVAPDETKDTPFKTDAPATQMRQAMRENDWGKADTYLHQALITGQDDPELLTDAAKVAALNNRKREAAGLLVQAAEVADYSPTSRVDFAIQGLIDVGELYRAIDLLKDVLHSHPDRLKYRKTLIGFLGEAERTDLITPHLKQLIERRVFDVPLLLAVTDTSARRYSYNTSKILMDRNPSDHRVRLGDAKEFLDKHDAVKCETLLREILDHHPDFAPAYALLGQALMEQRKLDLIPTWNDQAPEDTHQQTAYWLTLGDWSAAHQDFLQAAHSYWRSTQIDPNDSNAWIRLAATLRRLPKTLPHSVDEPTLAAIDERIERLLELRAVYYDFSWEGKDSQREAYKIASVLFSLGRTWEAEAWTAIATTLSRDPSDRLPSLRRSVLTRLRQDPSWVSKIDQPALQLDLSDWPATRLSSTERVARSTFVPKIETHGHLLLRDETETRGLAGFGAKSNPDDAKLAPLIRSTGIGGGTIDYDRDGWPDALIMGAGGTMLKTDSHPNELLRNLEGQFERVTEQAAVGDRGYGQGVAVGDFNEDGFADLFFANLGKNRLLRNNGDGTFTDCTDQLRDRDWQEWSTCGAFIDVNRDGITDLLTTNYCRTIENMDQACPDDQGVPGPCHPLVFPAHRDQFFLGTPLGNLVDRSDTLFVDVLPGRGLGIVAGTLNGSHLGAFIANDMSPNAYYTSQWDSSQSDPGKAGLIESGAASGLAVDGRTIAQASMGIACDDLDGDGDLDFYVTGFGREYNIVYDQVSPGLWQDITNQLGLVRPTLQLVGFGTEAIDFDDDGISELIVTNGHIGDFNEPDSLPYAQAMQLFRRDRSGGFDLVDDDAWGRYFREPHVGRALWTIDANRDGRSDVMVTHSYEPICLIVNHTTTDHHRVSFRLVGTDSSRDAIGAIIRFRCGSRTRTLWALSGSGYLCSNEPELRAGLGSETLITDVSVTWPDGSVEDFGTLSADQTYLLVQGDRTAYLDSKDSPQPSPAN